MADSSERMKLFICYSESHRRLFEEWFHPHVDETEFELVKQDLTTQGQGSIGQGDWLDAVRQKTDYIISAVTMEMGKSFLFSDVDIQFFGLKRSHLTPYLQDQDIVFQKDSYGITVCTGFFVCRCTEQTLALWQAVRSHLDQHPTQHDQTAMNIILQEKRFPIQYSFFPSAFYSPKELWEPGSKILVPQEILMHHANWTKGVDNKLAQLRLVREMVESRQGSPPLQFWMEEQLVRKPLYFIGKIRSKVGLS